MFNTDLESWPIWQLSMKVTGQHNGKQEGKSVLALFCADFATPTAMS